jgi:hypothetical protein
MSFLTTVIKEDSLASTLRIGFFGLAACSVVGAAAYVGYKAAGPNKSYALHNRNPESNDQVKNLKTNIFYQLKIFYIFHSNVIEIIYLAYPVFFNATSE